MQINNNYPSYQNHAYDSSHTHNITECMHEEQTKKWEGAMGSNKKESGTLQREQLKQDAMELSTLIQSENKIGENKKRGLSFVQGFWDSLGEDGAKEKTSVPMSVKETMLSNLQGVLQSAQMAVQNVLQQKLLSRLIGIPTAIKTEISTALKKFGKGREAFTTLSDEQMPSQQKNAHTKEKRQKGQVATKKKEEEIPMVQLSNNHLMDSYSKTGAYCKINENLTYQKPKAEKIKDN